MLPVQLQICSIGYIPLAVEWKIKSILTIVLDIYISRIWGIQEKGYFLKFLTDKCRPLTVLFILH